MKPKVFVTRKIPQPGLDLLEKEFDVEINPHDRVLTKDEILDGVKGKDALLCLLTDEIDEEVMDSEKNIKIISNYAVGFNNIDVNAATKRKIPVTNTPGVLTDTTADLAFTLMTAVARRISEADRFVRAGKFKGWAPMLLLGEDIYKRTLGIIGFGRIGQAVAKRGAKGFDMKVIYYDALGRNKEAEEELDAEFVELDELLQRSDFVSVHVPLMKETTHLIGEKELRLMKKTAYIINTSRGPVVDEQALVKSLQEGWIHGAGLDVFENEPEIEPGLLELDNAVLLPHIGSASTEARTKMATMAAQAVVDIMNNKIPENIVNKEVLS